MSAMARRSAQKKRWRTLLTHIPNHVNLDDLLWSSFAAHAKNSYLEAFLAACKGPALH